MESSSILSGNTNFRWGLPPPDPRYLSPPNLKTSLLLFGFELFDEVLVDCTSGHAERSKTKKRKRKERKNTKKNGRGNKKRRRKSATEVFFVSHVVGPRKILPVAENSISWTVGRNRAFDKPVVNSPSRSRNKKTMHLYEMNYFASCCYHRVHL